MGHGLSLHVQEHPVPLVLAGPGVPAGQVAARPVSDGRLADTIAAWAGLPARGRSLLDELWPGTPPEPVVVWTPAGVSVEDAGWRLLWTRADILLRRPSDWAHRRPFELYDAAADPAERRDRFHPADGRARRLLDLGRALLDPPARVADVE